MNHCKSTSSHAWPLRRSEAAIMRQRALFRHGIAAFMVLSLAIVVATGCAKTAAQTPTPKPPANDASSEASASPEYDLVFAVAGDSRTAQTWMDPKKKPDYSKYIDTAALGALRDDLISTWGGSPGFFFVHMGDIGIRGGKPVFDAFKKIMAPMQSANIPMYLVKGNHEVRYYVPKPDGGGKGGAETFANARKSQEQYQAAFKAPWLMPAGAKYPKGYEGLAYHFRRGSSAFIVMDSYFASKADNVYKKGYYSDFQLKWLQDTLIAYRKDTSVKNVFVMAHQPVFNAGKGDGTLYNKYDKNRKPSGASARSEWIMWALMDKYSVDAFFCGHSHFYHRWNVVGDQFAHTWNKSWKALGSEFDASNIRSLVGKVRPWPTTIPQVLNGTCGAPFEDLPSTSKVPAEAKAKKYNFSIVYVKDDVITVEVYAYDVVGGKAKHYLIDKFQKQDGQWQNLPLTEETR